MVLVAHRIPDTGFRAWNRYMDLMALPDGSRCGRDSGLEGSLFVGIPVRNYPVVKNAPLVVLRDDRVFG